MFWYIMYVFFISGRFLIWVLSFFFQSFALHVTAQVVNTSWQNLLSVYRWILCCFKSIVSVILTNALYIAKSSMVWLVMGVCNMDGKYPRLMLIFLHSWCESCCEKNTPMPPRRFVTSGWLFFKHEPSVKQYIVVIISAEQVIHLWCSYICLY